MNFQILDCTLRDGGYYTDWNFSDSLVKRYLDGIERSGIKLVELGYKSPSKSGFYGLYKYCPESQLQHLKKYKSVDFAFMLDAKEFIGKNNKIDKDALNDCVPAAKDSVFSWCRIATHPTTIEQANELIKALVKRGYKVCLNIMGSSLLTKGQLINTLSAIDQKSLEVLYFADSFGHFMPATLTQFINEIKPHIHTKLGFHAHDNQGLAYANALAAINAGSSYIDSTVLGMGRGAGNLRTEQILLGAYFNFKITTHNAFPILESVQEDFKPLKDQHHWGEDFSYTLSGLENIHPTYCQSLKSAHQYSIPQVSEILNSIPKGNRHKFSKDALIKAINTVTSESQHGQKAIEFKKEYRAKQHDKILIISNGPSTGEHKNAIQDYINEHNPLVIQCNPAKHTFTAKHHFTAILNEVRLQECSSKTPAIVTGLKKAPFTLKKTEVQHAPFKLKPQTFQLDASGITIPSFLVGAYAIGLALQSQPKEIALAGFDGFQTENLEHVEMQQVINLVQKNKAVKNIALYSLLPTAYDIPVQSIYAHLL